MVLVTLVAVFLGSSTLLADEVESSSTITLTACGHHDYAPWNWKRGNQIQGACAEVAKTLFKEVGVELDLSYQGPWKRCQFYIETGQVDVNICSFINDERNAYSAFIMTPMGINENAVFVKKGDEFSFNAWSDLIGKKVGLVLGVSLGKRFDNFLKANSEVERVASSRQNFHKLLHQRIDYIPMGRSAGLAMLYSYSAEDKIVALPTRILSGELYISMSKKSDYLYLLPAIEKQMQQQGYYPWVESLLEKYSHIYAKEANFEPIE
ncbi:ABC transporter substrate-binding protein [Agarivorans sp. TSD2052]|uniref:substrate-binding periplasmic protein n=1 Tax=Agarivorans sp. TSD2052 TaxID=2937286 RepID=UPI00200DDCA7|nr:ABC transporter substrate-binding protein [Agarivorans sp. TSD2052]UPW20730.1 ABC transporter substrate-binding protein [Agarivorans sp. TSD2052]